MKRRVIFSFMAVIVLMLLLVEVMVYFGVKQYYYQGIASTFQHHAETSSAFLKKYQSEELREYHEYSDDIINGVQYDGAEVDLVSRSGSIVMSSTGVKKEQLAQVPDEVLNGESTYRVEQDQETKEDILVTYSPLLYNGQVLAILRYSSSLYQVTATIWSVMRLALIVGAIISVIVFIISLILANSIVTPIKEITRDSLYMGKNNFQSRLKEAYPFELGDLSRTLNYMADEIQKTDRMKNEFISSISHELRTPLTGIKGWIETINGAVDLSKAEMEQGMTILSAETNRLIHLVEDLLDFSRLQSHRIILHKQKLSLANLVKEVKEQMQTEALQKDIQTKVSVEGDTNILGDRSRLKQVLINMYDNAVKYSHPHSVIHLTVQGNPNDVTITIQDRGIGIKDEDLPYVLETFYQSNYNQGGSGLGLAISNEIVSLHDGTIALESEINKGTSITVTLPRSPSHKASNYNEETS
ncbi:sensor histidine kinase [Pontibacillus salicampi]